MTYAQQDVNADFYFEIKISVIISTENSVFSM